VIRQGDIYWADLGEEPVGSGPAYRHPVVVLQNNLFNSSRIDTVVVCLLTTNLTRAGAPGNVRIEKGEAGLPETSVANVSQIATLDRNVLTEKVGTLQPERVQEILEGVYFLLEPLE
jgi:mRNA interferase MazF